MCGIAGWIDWTRDLRYEKDVVDRMGATLTVRGPDASGRWLGMHAGLAHRRLIVIDPTGGRQPMVRNVNGCEYVMVYNGELYNTAELQRELKSFGYVFEGYSDTETLLYAFIHWKEQCLPRLNGIYAFAIWNTSTQELFLARDRIGVKPLFFAPRPHGLLFGSEQKAILAHPAMKAEIDEIGLAELLCIGPARTPGHGVFKGIFELRPGYWARYNEKGLQERPYWAPTASRHTDSPEETVEHVRFLFHDTVKRQLVSDVPVCTFLSGGLDSSAITAAAAKSIAQRGWEPLSTYSVDYVENENNFVANSFQPDRDTSWAEKVARSVGTDHCSVFLTSHDLVEALKQGMTARDLPGMADIDVSLYLFCVKIKERFTVALSGECADEVFGGYPWFYQPPQVDHAFPWSNATSTRENLLAPKLRRRICPVDYIAQRYDEALAEVPYLDGENSQDRAIREMSYFNLTRWMPTLLDRKDRMSMAAGLEVRVPFCDHRLVEYVINIPWDLKNYGGYRKGILREALRGCMLEDVRLRPKNPYPKTFDPNYYALVKARLESLLANPQAPITEVLDTNFVRQLLTSEDDFERPWFGQLMRKPQMLAYLVQLNQWFAEYKVNIG